MVKYKQLVLLNAAHPICEDTNKVIELVSKNSLNFILNTIKHKTSVDVDAEGNTSFIVKFPSELYFKWLEDGQEMEIEYYNGDVSIPEFSTSLKDKTKMEYIYTDEGEVLGQIFIPASPRVISTILKKIIWKVNELYKKEEEQQEVEEINGNQTEGQSIPEQLP